MLDRFGPMRLASAALIVALTLSLSPAPSQADTGTLRVKVVRMGFIVGGGGGEGTLRYRGKLHPFTVSGIGVGIVGASAADMVGQAYNLRRAADIAGTYTAVGAGVTIVGGVKVLRLQNSNGVVLQLHGVQAGLDLSLNMNGITVAMR